jgi:hypothetical protein
MAKLKSAKFDQREQICHSTLFSIEATPKEHLDLGLICSLGWPRTRDKRTRTTVRARQRTRTKVRKRQRIRTTVRKRQRTRTKVKIIEFNLKTKILDRPFIIIYFFLFDCLYLKQYLNLHHFFTLLRIANVP